MKKIQQMVPDCEVSIHPLEETDALYAAIKDSDILVNATKVGMKPLDDQSLVEDVSVFHPDLVVADAVYNPKETNSCSPQRRQAVRSLSAAQVC